VSEEMMRSDDELVIEAREGNDEAFAELMLRHRSIAYRWALGISSDLHAAEDIIQEVIYLVYTHLSDLQDPMSTDSIYQVLSRSPYGYNVSLACVFLNAEIAVDRCQSGHPYSWLGSTARTL